MDLSGILAISGKPGLHKLVSQTKNGLIVESFIDQKRFPVYAAHQISALEEISMYTYTGEVALADVFKALFDHLEGKQAMSHKSPKNELLEMMEIVLPEYDQERVYISDIKKLVQWYNSLHEQGLLVFDEDTSTDSTSDEDTSTGSASEEEKTEE